MTSEIPANAGEIQVIRDENGRFVEGVSGNPEGKIKGTKNYITLLEEALEKRAVKENVSFYDKLAEWCFRYPKTATAILKKFIPDKNSTEITAPEGIEFIITKQTDETTTGKSNKDI